MCDRLTTIQLDGKSKANFSKGINKPINMQIMLKMTIYGKILMTVIIMLLRGEDLLLLLHYRNNGTHLECGEGLRFFLVVLADSSMLSGGRWGRRKRDR